MPDTIQDLFSYREVSMQPAGILFPAPSRRRRFFTFFPTMFLRIRLRRFFYFISFSTRFCVAPAGAFLLLDFSQKTFPVLEIFYLPNRIIRNFPVLFQFPADVLAEQTASEGMQPIKSPVFRLPT
ncbi:hypothetical protein [Paracoccus siganidrum]|uniref:hypothetical protein n=1 Tax=Paracoccus siganidrum TaxID=1276757 RepID=UPI0011C390FB|nr:hypothetical protein [Paracoccus siganidrum]